MTGLAKGSVSTGLAALEKTGMISAAGSGRVRLYQLRPDHKLRVSLDALFLAEEQRFDAVKDAIRGVSRGWGPDLLAVWIYGSLARGEDRPESDLDIALVTTPQEREKIVERFRENLREIAEELGFVPSIVSLDTEDVDRLVQEQDPWWIAMARDAKTLFGPLPKDMLVQCRTRERNQNEAA